MAIEQPTYTPAAAEPGPDLNDPSLFINRELSWLDFNERVLEEAQDQKRPLMERIKFTAIFASNLDEFFMVRVAGLRKQLAGGALEAPPDGMTPAEQLAAVRLRLQPDLEAHMATWREQEEELAAEDIHILQLQDLKKKQRKLLRKYFEKQIFPVLTPLAFDPSHPFPHISNLSINLAVVVDEPGVGERFARVKVPHGLPRLLRIPSEDKADSFENLGLVEVAANNFVWLEEVVMANLDLLFPGLEVVAAYPFRVTRDADVEIEEDEASDLLIAITEGIEQRQFLSAVRLEVDGTMPPALRDVLSANLDLAPYQVFEKEGPLGLSDLLALPDLVDRPDLKEPPFVPKVPPVLVTDETIFSILQRRDVLLFHPYDSFNPVVDFIQNAAHDPQVLAIKQTLYRVGTNSPIVTALLEARRNNKQVAVLVELKARFDEDTNIEWARALEEAGVHVVYGVRGLKTHSKLAIVVRQEPDGIRRYAHLSTGNYNVGTSRVYTDFGLFTADLDITEDVLNVFNSLTGYSRITEYRKLLVAPTTLRRELSRRIDREIQLHEESGGGRLRFKMNALVDREMITDLYRASQAGVEVELQVRGICCLRPGVPGISDNIKVTSIVGRFLEHVRIYEFGNGGNPEIFVGSADLMPRNLNRRVEVLFPIESAEIRRLISNEIFELHLKDNVQARELTAGGDYRPVDPGDGPEVDAQMLMLESRAGWTAP